jgi:tetratricopeptide (TPR) repeat protein
MLLNQLGNFYLGAGQTRKAIDVFGQVLRIDPENLSALQMRGNANLNLGEHAAAIDDFSRALKLEEDENDGLLNNFAWVLATSPNDELRDGRRAVELATRACEAAGYETPHILSTLAASYAETGDFDSAIKWSQKAVEFSQKGIDAATDDKQKERLKKDHAQLTQELASYKAGKPWRERQTAEEGQSPKPADAKSATPSDKSVSERKLDF